MIGWRELLIVFLIIFLLFGAKKLPQVARALGKAKKEFENPTEEEGDDKPRESSEEIAREKKENSDPDTTL